MPAQSSVELLDKQIGKLGFLQERKAPLAITISRTSNKRSDFNDCQHGITACASSFSLQRVFYFFLLGTCAVLRTAVMYISSYFILPSRLPSKAGYVKPGPLSALFLYVSSRCLNITYMKTSSSARDSPNSGTAAVLGKPRQPYI